MAFDGVASFHPFTFKSSFLLLIRKAYHSPLHLERGWGEASLSLYLPLTDNLFVQQFFHHRLDVGVCGR